MQAACAGMVARLRFIRRAQQPGFTLEEIGELLPLQDGIDRRSIRRIAAQRLQQIRGRADDLQRMAKSLWNFEPLAPTEFNPWSMLMLLALNQASRARRGAHGHD